MTARTASEPVNRVQGPEKSCKRTSEKIRVLCGVAAGNAIWLDVNSGSRQVRNTVPVSKSPEKTEDTT